MGVRPASAALTTNGAEKWLPMVLSSSIGTGDDKEFGGLTGGEGGLQLTLGSVSRYDCLASHMAAALGVCLILDDQAVNTHRLISTHGASDIFGIPVAIVAINNDRRFVCRNNVAHTGRDFPETGKPKIGNAKTACHEPKPADRVGVEACFCNEARREGVMRARQQQRFVLR